MAACPEKAGRPTIQPDSELPRRRIDRVTALAARLAANAITAGRQGFAQRPAVEYVRVDHRRADVSMTEQLLNGSDVVAILEQMGCARRDDDDLHARGEGAPQSGAESTRHPSRAPREAVTCLSFASIDPLTGQH